MPAVTYLSDSEARRFLTVESDKDCDELLQEMNAITGRTWLIQVRRWFEPRGLFRHAVEHKDYTLYLDCHGEYQVMSLVAPGGSSIFHANPNSREAVMNYMLGYLGGIERPEVADTRRTDGAGSPPPEIFADQQAPLMSTSSTSELLALADSIEECQSLTTIERVYDRKFASDPHWEEPRELTDDERSSIVSALRLAATPKAGVDREVIARSTGRTRSAFISHNRRCEVDGSGLSHRMKCSVSMIAF